MLGGNADLNMFKYFAIDVSMRIVPTGCPTWNVTSSTPNNFLTCSLSSTLKVSTRSKFRSRSHFRSLASFVSSLSLIAAMGKPKSPYNKDKKSKKPKSTDVSQPSASTSTPKGSSAPPTSTAALTGSRTSCPPFSPSFKHPPCPPSTHQWRA